MELKLPFYLSKLQFYNSFNRTAYGIEIVISEVKKAYQSLLLIAPLMELKCS